MVAPKNITGRELSDCWTQTYIWNPSPLCKRQPSQFYWNCQHSLFHIFLWHYTKTENGL